MNGRRSGCILRRMRREIFRMSQDDAVALLRRAPVVRLASANAAGEPLLRVVHAVVVGESLCFHSSANGEKTEALGRPAVASADETVAILPSHFSGDHACSAATLYRSVQVHGRLEAVADPAAKAAVFEALMARFQPEGGYVPIAAEDPAYRKEIDGLLIVRLPLERVDGKAKLAQNKSPEERRTIVERLWARGAGGDVRAIRLVLDANPGTPLPAFLSAPEGVRLVPELEEGELAAAAALLDGSYWTAGLSREVQVRAFRGSSARVGAVDSQGALVACARALSDGARKAWIYDVVTAPAWRGKGVANAMMRLLLDHPAVRGARRVLLETRDAQAFYRKLGFAESASLPPRPFSSTEMALVR